MPKEKRNKKKMKTFKAWIGVNKGTPYFLSDLLVDPLKTGKDVKATVYQDVCRVEVREV